jgi:topoisomerase-4 subunit A
MVWFDRDVLRLNYDGRGELLGEFHNEDLILVILDNGDFYTTNYELTNHYESNILVIERFDNRKVWTAVLYDAEQKFPYLKRFQLEPSVRKQNILGDNAGNKLYHLTSETYPRLQVSFGGNNSFREDVTVDAEQFVGVKSFKAKGKRIATWQLESVTELAPTRVPEPELESADAEADTAEVDEDESSEANLFEGES